MKSIQEIVALAQQIATQAHEGQVRRGTLVPYIEHPQSMVNRLADDPELQVVAWLHDVLEDSSETAESLAAAGIPEDLVAAVVLLTREPNVPDETYYQRISESHIATAVKVADMISNLADRPTRKQIRRYAKGLLILTPDTDDGTRGTAIKKHERDSLLRVIGEGLKDHSDAPVAWLKSFVEEMAERQGVCALADRSELPPEIALLDKPPIVIVADCGTGETKLLLYNVQAGSVRFKQLVKLGPASSYVDTPKEFVATIKEQFDQHEADMVLVAASAWMRDASPQLVERGNDLLQQLTDAVVIWKTLGPREEAWLELAAAEYACEKLNVTIDASWAAGGGSTQMTQGFTDIYTHTIGNQEGLALLKAKGTREGLNQWRERVRRFYQDQQVRLSGLVLGMSAVSHAAKACGLAIREPLPRQEVLRSFDTFIERQSAVEGLCGDDLLDLANVAQQRETLDLVVAEDAFLFFVREIGDEEAHIRITWSLGWYLELLAIMGHLTTPRGTLRRLWEDRAKLGKIGSDFSGGISTLAAEAKGQVLLDLERGANALRDRARLFEAKVTDKLHSVAAEYGARLEGENHRLKTGESLERKLKQRLSRLLEKHRSHRFYYPRLADVFHEVDDALRYTMVMGDKAYSDTTLAVLGALMAQLPSTHQYFNYWAKDSTYRGINAFIKCDDFTFELQFHTEASWQVKQQASHEIYECFRVLPAGRAKYVLYEYMKGLWDEVRMPSGVEQLNKPAPMRDLLMEQLGQLLALKRRCAGLALPILDGSAFSNAEERRAALDGLGCRLIRGTEPSHFETLAYSSEGKRLAWISKLSEVEPVANLREAIIRLMGKPAAWVDKKLAQNHTWKLVLMPMQVCWPATWDGVFRSIHYAYPEVANKVLNFSVALKETPFVKIQEQINPPCTFRDLKDANPPHPQYVDLQRLLEIPEPTLWQVRAFLYIVLGLNEQFMGDGFTYDETGAQHSPEYLLMNEEIAKIPGCEVFELSNALATNGFVAQPAQPAGGRAVKLG